MPHRSGKTAGVQQTGMIVQENRATGIAPHIRQNRRSSNPCGYYSAASDNGGCAAYSTESYLDAFEKDSQKLRIVWIRPPKTRVSSSFILPESSF